MVVQNYNVMGVAKAALESAVRYMAAELGPKGIRVHAISPGPLSTRAASGIPEFDELLEKARAKAPARSLVSIEDVGIATAFLAYVGLAGPAPQVGIYGYLLGGLGYALLGSSRQLAIGPTSAISLMIAGTVGAMAEGDAQHYAQIASLAAFTVAALCVFAWLFRLSVLVKLISDSILVGFKIGAGLTIAMTQLPSLFGVAGGGHNFFERVLLLVGQLGQMHYLVLAVGAVAIVLILLGE